MYESTRVRSFKLPFCIYAFVHVHYDISVSKRSALLSVGLYILRIWNNVYKIDISTLHFTISFFSRYLDSNQITSLDETIFNGLTVLRNLWVNCKHHIFATLVTRYDITFSQILTRFILFLTNFYLIIM